MFVAEETESLLNPFVCLHILLPFTDQPVILNLC